MAAYIARRLIWVVFLLFVITLITFFIFSVLPAGDPAVARAGRQPSPELIANIRAQLGLDKSKPVQFINYIGDLLPFVGHNGVYFGFSYQNNTDVLPEILKRLPTKQVVLVNATSASGPFIDGLSAPGRTIVTATRSGAEHFTTLFGGFFIDALTSEAADADKNKRVSVLEAFKFAKTEVARAYEREGLLATEHALLDDDGDKEGSADPSNTGNDPKNKDGKVAAVLSLGVAGDDGLPSDPKLRALHVERRDLERRVESLRLLKESMDPAKYSAELEKLATAIALKTREIRAAEGK